MFSNRFLKFPVEIVKKADEVLGTPEEVLCIEDMRVNPFEITAYRKHYDDNGVYDERVTVEFKNRDNMIVILSIEKFEDLLNKHGVVD